MWGLTRAAAVGVCALAGAVVQAAESRPIAIVHGTLVDGRGGPPIRLGFWFLVDGQTHRE